MCEVLGMQKPVAAVLLVGIPRRSEGIVVGARYLIVNFKVVDPSCTAQSYTRAI